MAYDASELIKRYAARLENEELSSQEYRSFKQEMLHEQTRYERLANSLGSLLTIKLAEKDRLKVQQYLAEAHVTVSPSQALTLSLVGMLSIFFLSLLTLALIYVLTGTFQATLLFLGIIASLFSFYFLYTYPRRLAHAWKLKASSQMVPAVLYVVVYMKHTSNLERAIEFAAQHLEGPLALDFKKIFYNVEIGKFSTIKQSLENYLEFWRKDAPEFNESFHLIESSLYEPSESRRIEILEKALQVILDGVYEKMLKYSREIRSPLTNIYMLGIILPTLALALLPLASTLLQGSIQWYHIFVLFNILVPCFVFYLTSEVLLKRPGGYGEASLLELNPGYGLFISKSPWYHSALLMIPLLLIGLLPFIIHLLAPSLGIQSDITFGQLGFPFLQNAKLFDFKSLGSDTVGPFGAFAALLSLAIPLGIAFFFSLAYKEKTLPLMESREKTKQLESEFTSSLFQLGNRLGDNIPAEIAFGKVAESTEGQATQQFFSLVNHNIQESGMSVEKALFDKKRGAIIYFPSPLIATSMKILTESVKKGLQVAARSIMAISDYVKNINKINQRLHDLLAEIVSDMKSNMTFLAPLLAGIVVGLATMITVILTRLSELQQSFSANQEGLGTLGDIAKIFNITEMIPPYFLQVIIGIYLIEIVFILTQALVTVDSGKDPLKEKFELSKNLKRSILLYSITALISIVSLTLLASIALTQI